MTTESRTIDPARLREKQQLIGGYSTGLFQSGIIFLGLELGILKAMRGGDAVRAEDLAAKLQLNERFLLEWLRAAAAGGVLDYEGDDRFSLGGEVESLLTDETNLGTVRWFFTSLPDRVGLWNLVPEAFRTGIGFDWDARGPRAIEWMEGGFRNWYEQVLVQRALPALDGIVPRLESGIGVADVGCGAGIALIQMARAYPSSRFHGYDSSANAIARARQNGDGAGLPNLTFHQVPDELLPGDHSLGLITTFDCLHDMTRPLETCRAIRQALADDGYWFIADINSLPTFEENLALNPQSARFYANSVFGCLQSAMSEAGGAGLGTYGLPEPKMKELALEAGFTRFRRVDLPSPINAYYEARP